MIESTHNAMSGADPSKVVEIPGSPLKLAMLLVLGIGMTAAGGWVAIAAGIVGAIVGVVAVVFFGACTVIIFLRLLSGTGTVVTLSPHGIRDVRLSDDTVPWSAVQNIGTWSMQGQSFVVLGLDPAIEQTLKLKAMVRWTRSANSHLGADGLSVGAQGLKLGFDELVDLIEAYWLAHRET